MQCADSSAVHLSDLLAPQPEGFAKEDSSVVSWSHDCEKLSALLLCSSLLSDLKSCCAQENKMEVRNSQCRDLHAVGVQLLCLLFIRDHR